MTCIVGAAYNGVVMLGGDSLLVDSYGRKVLSRSPKVFQSGSVLIGWSGSVRMGQILQYGIKPIDTQDIMGKRDIPDPMEWLFKVFILQVQESFQKAGWERKTDNGRLDGGDFLVGFRGELYRVESDFQVTRPSCQFDAIGSGGELALGALMILTGSRRRVPIKVALASALDVAARGNAFVEGPFSFIFQEVK